MALAASDFCGGTFDKQKGEGPQRMPNEKAKEPINTRWASLKIRSTTT
jgi:hypothetical protein